MECADVATFTFRYVTDKILFTLQAYFAVLEKRTELPSSFIEARSTIARKMENLQAKQRTRHNVQGLRHW